MSLKQLFKISLLSTVLTSSLAMAAEIATTTATAPITQAQKKEIEGIVHEYLVKNPEVLIEASQALQAKQQQGMQQQAQTAIKNHANQLFQEKIASAGHPKSNVTVVEFFDYQCIHCKRMSAIMDDLVKKDSDLLVIYREFPIFGKTSDFAAKVALAAGKQGKYLAMHNALLSASKRLDEKGILALAQSLKLNMEQLNKDKDSKEISNILDTNKQLAEKLHLMGTPAFIIAATPKGVFNKDSEPSFLPGAADEKTLQELIKKAAGN